MRQRLFGRRRALNFRSMIECEPGEREQQQPDQADGGTDPVPGVQLLEPERAMALAAGANGCAVGEAGNGKFLRLLSPPPVSRTTRISKSKRIRMSAAEAHAVGVIGSGGMRPLTAEPKLCRIGTSTPSGSMIY